MCVVDNAQPIKQHLPYALNFEQDDGSKMLASSLIFEAKACAFTFSGGVPLYLRAGYLPRFRTPPQKLGRHDTSQLAQKSTYKKGPAGTIHEKLKADTNLEKAACVKIKALMQNMKTKA